MIYLIDTIGNWSGMHKYDEAFLAKCRQAGSNINLIGNFDSEDICLKLHNYYRGGKLKRYAFLLIDLLRVYCYAIFHKGTYIYQSFGLRPLDKLFYLVISASRKTYMLVHDLYQLKSGYYGRVNHSSDNSFYRKCVGYYICHSMSVVEKLKSICAGRGAQFLYTPHLEYQYSTVYDESTIPDGIKEVFNPEMKCFLLFGQVSRTKGVDIAIEAWKQLEGTCNRLIVAGTDRDKVLSGLTPNDNLRIVSRYIKDDELNYLFNHADCIILPYREIYQSGVLETVVHFRKQSILSPVDAFSSYLERYPSFGVLMKENTPDALAECVLHMDWNRREYDINDIKRYAQDHDLNPLLSQMGEL